MLRFRCQTVRNLAALNAQPGREVPDFERYASRYSCSAVALFSRSSLEL
jgi:hypothetical protein